MQSRLKNLVLDIAEQCRQWLDDLIDQEDAVSTSGYCAVASAHLFERLRAAGVEATISVYESDDGCHVFVISDDHVVDITADQFSEYKSVRVLFEHHRLCNTQWHGISRTFSTVAGLKKYQRRTGWPMDQMVRSRAIDRRAAELL